MKADNIVVLQKGTVIQQGTHRDLMSREDGAYWSLVNAQRLSITHDTVEATEKKEAIVQVFSNNAEETLSNVDLEEANNSNILVVTATSSIGSFQLFLWEQRHQLVWYSVMLLGSIGAGGMPNFFASTISELELTTSLAAFPLHSFLFAKLISIFNLWGQELQDQTNFWCLMFTLLALGVGISYFSLGWSSNTVAFVSGAQSLVNTHLS